MLKGNSRTLRNTIKWDTQTSLVLPLIHTGVDRGNNPFQDAERVGQPPEVSTASTAKGETGRTDSEQGGSSLTNKLGFTSREAS